jgi:hypothetical protein
LITLSGGATIVVVGRLRVKDSFLPHLCIDATLIPLHFQTFSEHKINFGRKVGASFPVVCRVNIEYGSEDVVILLKCGPHQEHRV